ncbi:hypothetical protein O3G_MSEX007157 [Manduca sexta]|uniref:Carboxylic ester hydrolase n=2 Tax=Manduca sexta TaxID=7130 RepID=A0A921Z4W9_MANSE|nr:hypothetical protein O3G_MSEX007157 [Manduca sexta]KAG6451454.1 hypothetical protein O3G_MSEX007157 [Manduca sexta]UXP71995.1 esterase [Manduca sexta]
MSDLIVEVQEGKLRGLISRTDNDFVYYTFKGIPYAKPPLGELRFAAPQPAEPWEGIKDATKECNICPQVDKETGYVIGNEDCLFLNVYTPKLPENDKPPLPVMVYLHGGGFVFGHGTDATAHGPDFLVQRDVVVVSINYRLGVLGFVTLNRKEAAGNMGLKDQVQALKWVQKNIAKFGGDPNNVTIFGVSAGGASVEYLLLSLTARGLFHKSIIQSGSSLNQWAQKDRNEIKANAYRIAKVAGKDIINDDQLLDYLKKLPVEELIKLSMSVILTDSFKGGINFTFVPCVEEEGDWESFISKSTYKIISEGEFTKVPVMVGFCEREGLLVVSHAAPILEKLTNEQNFLDHFPFDIRADEQKDMEARLKNIYLGIENYSGEKDTFAIDFFSDVDFCGGVYVAASCMAKYNSPTYFYEFCYDGNLNYLKTAYGINRAGAAHGDDGGYLLKSSKLTKELNDTDVFVQNCMLSMWTNFAKFGNPTPESDNSIPIKWQPMSEDGESYLVIDKTLSMRKEFSPQRMKIYEELYKNEDEA